MDGGLEEGGVLCDPAEHQPLRRVEADARRDAATPHRAGKVILFLLDVVDEGARVHLHKTRAPRVLTTVTFVDVGGCAHTVGRKVGFTIPIV